MNPITGIRSLSQPRGLKLLSLLAAAIIVSGCNSQLNPQTRSVGSAGSALVSDARARTLISSNIGTFSRPGLVDPIQITCAEPPPDVATAAANSLSAGLSIFGQGSGSLTAQSAIGLAQIAERTASIQLLQHKMFHTCLAYKNGAISGTAYTLAMSRLDDSMVTLLTSENAVGRFGLGMATIDTGAAGAAQASLAQTMEALETARDASAELQTMMNQQEAAAGNTEENGENSPDPEPAPLPPAEQVGETSDRLNAALATAAAGAAQAAANIEANRDFTGFPPATAASAVEEIQENFLEYDYTQRAMDACLVELALAPGAGFEYTPNENGDGEGLQFSPETPDNEIFDLLMGYPDEENVSAQAALTRGAFGRAIAGNPGAWLPEIVAAYNVTRQSGLSMLCGRYLPEFISQQAVNHNRYRLTRLQNEQIDARVAGLQAFSSALTQCANAPEAQREGCVAAASAALEAMSQPVSTGSPAEEPAG